ncbi:MAG TPA: hypothetical protein GXZ24_08950 [Firmicutes bacterium]|jgi:hypothetical protein|nr:hypothetical protein [Bacillota bacterium]
MYNVRHKAYSKILLPTFGVLLLICLMGAWTCPVVLGEMGKAEEPGPVSEPGPDPMGPVLEIVGDGVENALSFTLAELEAMQQCEQVYSTINTWPTKRWYMARGIKLRDLLELATIKESATLLKFIGKDGYGTNLTVKELLENKRYFFPGLKENHPYDGSVPGSTEDAVEVEPLISLVSAEDSNDPADMDDRNGLMLVLGQRAVTEQTMLLYVFHLRRIEVLTNELEKWDAPRVNVPDGAVLPPGVGLTLQNKYSDADKIHYTIDGSDPTVDSPMFNWSAKRWWEQREDVDSINIPLEIIKEMISDSYEGESIVVLKLRTIGPGREDSEIATYTFRIDPDAEDPTELASGPPTGIFLDQDRLELQVGGTFQLDANIKPFNTGDRGIIWRSSDTSVATVDTRGLVTVVGQGSAMITAETVEGGFTAVCVINGPVGGEGGTGVTADGENSQPKEGDSHRHQTPLEEESFSPTGLPAEPDMKESVAGSIFHKDEGWLPAKEGNWCHLSRPEDLPDDPIRENPVAEHFQSTSPQPQVFGLLIDNVIPLPLQEQQKDLIPYVATIFLFLFFCGVSKGYAEYNREH